MRILLPLLAVSSLMLFSCQKEAEFANRTVTSGNNNNTTTGTLLVKMVQKNNSDSLVTTYTYNGNKQLVSLKKVGVDDQGDVVNREYHYHRNSSGIITDFSVIDADLLSVGIDSITTIVHYSSSRYTSYVLKISVPGFSLLDSSVYAYDGSGRINREDLYESPSGTGTDYFLSGKVNYSYSASGNISQLDIHDLDASGAEVFSASSKLNYDAKINPMQFENESFVMGHPEWRSVNNVSGEQLSDSNGPADNQTVAITYIYNSYNKPETSVTTAMPDNLIINTSFYYQ